MYIYIYPCVCTFSPSRFQREVCAAEDARADRAAQSQSETLLWMPWPLLIFVYKCIYIRMYVYMYTCIYISLQMDAFVPLGCLCRFNRMRGSDRKIQAHVWMQGLVRRFVFHRAGQGRPCRAARGWSWLFSQGRPGKAIQGRSGISDRPVPSQQVGPLGSTLEDL